MFFHALANPARFQRTSNKLLPWLSATCVVSLAYAIYLSLFASPPDYQQGETVRIMYIHVPAAYLAVGIYSFMACMSAMFLVWKHPLADILAQAAAPIGAAFTLLTLITGSLWGKPMWGAWWVWDARLTSVLILFFLYLGYIAIQDSFDHVEKERKIAAIMAIIGFINVPIIKFSVEWWNTLHQPASLLRMDGPSVDGSMLPPLLWMMGAFTLFFLVTLCLRVDSLLIKQRASRLRALRF